MTLPIVLLQWPLETGGTDPSDTNKPPGKIGSLTFYFLNSLPARLGLTSQSQVQQSEQRKTLRERPPHLARARAAQEAAVWMASPPPSEGHLAAWRCPRLPRNPPDFWARLPRAPPPLRPPRRRSSASARRSQPTSPSPVPVEAAAGLLRPGCSRQPCGTLRPGAAQQVATGLATAEVRHPRGHDPPAAALALLCARPRPPPLDRPRSAPRGRTTFRSLVRRVPTPPAARPAAAAAAGRVCRALAGKPPHPPAWRRCRGSRPSRPDLRGSGFPRDPDCSRPLPGHLGLRGSPGPGTPDPPSEAGGQRTGGSGRRGG